MAFDEERLSRLAEHLGAHFEPTITMYVSSELSRIIWRYFSKVSKLALEVRSVKRQGSELEMEKQESTKTNHRLVLLLLLFDNKSCLSCRTSPDQLRGPVGKAGNYCWQTRRTCIPNYK